MRCPRLLATGQVSSLSECRWPSCQAPARRRAVAEASCGELSSSRAPILERGRQCRLTVRCISSARARICGRVVGVWSAIFWRFRAPTRNPTRVPPLNDFGRGERASTRGMQNGSPRAPVHALTHWSRVSCRSRLTHRTGNLPCPTSQPALTTRKYSTTVSDCTANALLHGDDRI
jgi:hypothetical protein